MKRSAPSSSTRDEDLSSGTRGLQQETLSKSFMDAFPQPVVSHYPPTFSTVDAHANRIPLRAARMARLECERVNSLWRFRTIDLISLNHVEISSHRPHGPSTTFISLTTSRPHKQERIIEEESGHLPNPGRKSRIAADQGHYETACEGATKGDPVVRNQGKNRQVETDG